MMRISKLVMLAVLSGTLGLVGCGDDASTSVGGSGGSGGTAGTGGTGGSGLEACGADETLDETFTTAEGSVSCDGLGVVTVPIGVVLAAKPMGDITGDVDFDVQVQFIIDEATVGMLGGLVQTAEIDESSADLADAEGNGTVNVPATVPCSVDFTGGEAITVTTPATTGTWTAADGSIVLEAADMTFSIAMPVPLGLSTKDPDPACTWVTMPSITF